MKDHTTTIAKIFVVTLAATILALTTFGLGVYVGTRTHASAALPPTPAIAVERALPLAVSPQPNANVQTPSPEPAPRPTALASAPSPTPRPAARAADEKIPLDTALLQEVWTLLQQQFYGDLPQGEEVTYDAIRGIVDRLGDQHTGFSDPKAAAMFISDMEGQFEGIGAQVELAESGGVRLQYLFANQPAEKAGLLAGDVITAVDGKDVTKLTLMEAIVLIRGPRGTKVVLTIHRADQPAMDVTVTRARIEIPVVETKTLADGKIQYVSLSEFSSVAPKRLSDAVNTALAKKPAGLILDLRGNPGGLLDAAVSIGSYFVPRGSILIERSKDGAEKVYQRQGTYLLGSTPLVVLVDGGSASAAEIVAGAIQDAGTGVLIGEKTYGKGSVQIPNVLSDGSQLRVTIAHWFTPKDRGIHGTGLEPDVKVSLTKEDVAAKRDPQLDRAVEYLLTGK
ncbi:MAG: S41 family peptidase [Chloroflexi bacterium]|nr:S41 family peptidase [Chloroflexota bacterium]